jgi:hypothetical protein
MRHLLSSPRNIRLGRKELGQAKSFKKTSLKLPLKFFACIILTLIVLGAIPRALADTGDVAYIFGNSLDDGGSISQYTLYYTIPSVIQAGVPTNVSLYLYITEMTGWKVYDYGMSLTLSINTPTESKTVFSQKVWDNSTTYQGYRWGPFNMTVELSNSQIGLSPGQSTTLNYFGYFTAIEQWNDPHAPYLTPVGEPLQLPGNFTVQASTSATPVPVSHQTATTIAVGAVIIAALTIVALATRKRGPSSN